MSTLNFIQCQLFDDDRKNAPKSPRFPNFWFLVSPETWDPEEIRNLVWHLMEQNGTLTLNIRPLLDLLNRVKLLHVRVRSKIIIFAAISPPSRKRGAIRGRRREKRMPPAAG
jgi:hypothetical protein